MEQIKAILKSQLEFYVSLYDECEMMSTQWNDVNIHIYRIMQLTKALTKF